LFVVADVYALLTVANALLGESPVLSSEPLSASTYQASPNIVAPPPNISEGRIFEPYFKQGI